MLVISQRGSFFTRDVSEWTKYPFSLENAPAEVFKSKEPLLKHNVLFTKIAYS